VVTEVMAIDQVKPVAEKADVLQIGARNMQNFDLLRRSAARAGGLAKRGAGSTWTSGSAPPSTSWRPARCA